jgi:kumamolisin
MRTIAECLSVIFVLSLGLSERAAAQEAASKPGAGSVIFPQSSIRRPQTLAAGLEQEAKAFTDVAEFVPAAPLLEPPTKAVPSASGYFVETPASLACVYGLVAKTEGCSPNSAWQNPEGGKNVIAIVDAYHTPNIVADLAVFCDRFNLKPAKLEIIFSSGNPPATVDKGWELETSLDVEWAHAFAPDAKILLVEADSSSLKDLLRAEDLAGAYVSANGGGEVSNSWGLREFTGENNAGFDGHFLSKNVVYFAASGDTSDVSWPSTSPNVVCIGGTHIVRDSNGSFVEETTWADAGAGLSIEPRPHFQDSVAQKVKSLRGCVDLAAVASPETGGVWVYDSANALSVQNKGWVPLGGTSAATPIAAAIANSAGRFFPSSEDQLEAIYAEKTGFYDVKTGVCGESKAELGWDVCTGMGSPRGKDGFN